MQNNQEIIHSYAIDGSGFGNRLNGEDISKTIRDDRLAWVHLQGDSLATRVWLEKEITYLDQIIIDALLAEETRPRIVEFEKGVILILRGINLNDQAQPEDMVSVRLWVDQYRIISIRTHPLRAVKDIEHKLEIGKGPKSAGDFVTMLVSRMFERMEPVFLALDEDLDNVEEIVMDTPEKKNRQIITAIRKQTIKYRRYIAPQRDVIALLRISDIPWLDQIHKRRLQESLDRIVRYMEDLDTIRERAHIVKDELANGLADKMNKNMYVLSLVAAIFLPLGFFTGLLGINIGGIPGAENSHAFLFFCGILLFIVFIQMAIFKKYDWL